MGKARTVAAWVGQNGATTGLALVAGSLSFSHIHDLAAAHGQAGWKAWLYPASVDAVTVYALRMILSPALGRSVRVTAWCTFLLFSAASLAANVLDAPVRDVVGVAVAAAPSLAFLAATVLGHLAAHSRTPASPGPESEPAPVAPPATVPAARTPRRRSAPGASAPSSGAPVLKDLVGEFLRTYQGPESGRVAAFHAYSARVLQAAGASPRSIGTCRNVLGAHLVKPQAGARVGNQVAIS